MKASPMARIQAPVVRPAASGRGRCSVVARASSQKTLPGAGLLAVAISTVARPSTAAPSRDLLSELTYPGSAPAAPSAPVSIPSPSIPSVQIPSAELPSVELPSVQVPSVDLPSVELPSVELPSELLDSPLLIGAAVAAVAAPLLFKAFSRGNSIKAVSAAAAFEALAESDTLVPIDIRCKAEVRKDGSPDVRSTKKKLIPIPFAQLSKGELVVDEQKFVTSLAKVANPEASTLLLIDSFGPQSMKAAKLATAAGYREVLCVKGGCEGAGGWRESELPWREPFRVDLESLKKLDITGMTKLADKLAEEYKESPTVVKGGLAVAAAGAAAFVLFNEVEIILEVLGVWAAAQFLAKKLLFAEDREKTLAQLKSLFKERIAAGEAGDDLKRLAGTVFNSENAEGIETQVEAAKAAEVAEGGAPAESPAAEPTAAASPPPSSSSSLSGAEADIAQRKGEVQAWVSAWRERSKVMA